MESELTCPSPWARGWGRVVADWGAAWGFRGSQSTLPANGKHYLQHQTCPGISCHTYCRATGHEQGDQRATVP